MKGVEKIAHRVLRNESGRILREAEAGGEFTITVDGRPVAILSPYRPRRWVSRGDITRILATPTDENMLDDLLKQGPGELDDPWERS